LLDWVFLLSDSTFLGGWVFFFILFAFRSWFLALWAIGRLATRIVGHFIRNFIVRMVVQERVVGAEVAVFRHLQVELSIGYFRIVNLEPTCLAEHLSYRGL